MEVKLFIFFATTSLKQKMTGICFGKENFSQISNGISIVVEHECNHFKQQKT